MRKETVTYSTALDAFIAVIKRLNVHESRENMDSEQFFDLYNRGQISDDAVFVEWANDYRHYLALRFELEKKLEDAA